MADLTLPNKWGSEGFNVIREAIIEYCKDAGTPVDLGYAFQWDTAVPLIKKSENLSDDQFRNCDTALATITDYLNQGMDPWAAVAAAKKDWIAERESAQHAIADHLDRRENSEA